MAKRPPHPSIPDEDDSIPDEYAEVFADPAAEVDPAAEPLPAIPPATLQQDVPADTDLRFQVLVLDPGGDVQPCAVRSPRARRLTIRGESYEHVAEAQDGTWIYERRPW